MNLLIFIRKQEYHQRFIFINVHNQIIYKAKLKIIDMSSENNRVVQKIDKLLYLIYT